jgi:hypothetical protein
MVLKSENISLLSGSVLVFQGFAGGLYGSAYVGRFANERNDVPDRIIV